MEQMTVDQYMAAIRPKVQGTWNLHEISLLCCPLFPGLLDYRANATMPRVEAMRMHLPGTVL